ncbi:diguanylate cyclase [Candidatus Fermentibacteria bacterium]|nr:diguanylate cyclase [Candidatus Fermentibacteria bacterium]
MDSPHKDELTGLPRRDALDRLGREFESRPDGEVWSVIIVDVDHFKMINDVYGHLNGDRVLRQVADLLMRNNRSGDTPLRYGGDEFVVVMPGTEKMLAANLAQRILEDLEHEVFPQDMEVSLSLGVADSGSVGRNLAKVLERADQALYQAKNSGRGKVSFFEEETGRRQPGISFDHFVDRHYELRKLRTLLDEAIEEGGRFALVQGEPGVGKSRLVQELRHYCDFKGCCYLQTKCDELGASRPYTLVTGPMDDHLSVLPEARRSELAVSVGPVQRQTADLFPSLPLEVRAETASDQEGALSSVVYSEVTRLLSLMSEERPVVFHLDDLQWISSHDLDLLGYLVRNTTGSRVFFVSTMRTPIDSFPEVHKQVRVLSRLVPFLSLDLEALQGEYASHMVMFALRDPHIPKEVLKRLVRQSGGNPFYLRELLKSLREKGSIVSTESGGWKYRIGEEIPLPQSISQLVGSRLEKLDDLSLEVIQTGALAISGFRISLLSEVLDRSELEVARALEKPLKMELIRESVGRDGVPEYSFIHDTVRNYLYNRMTMGMRKAIHGKFGEYFERLYREGNRDVLNRLAHYYSDGLNRGKAAEYTLQAARDALAKDANRDARRWLESYLDHVSPSEEDPETAFEVRLRLAKVYVMLAEHENAEDTLELAGRYARSDRDKGLVHLERGQLFYNRGSYGEAAEELANLEGLLPEGEELIGSRMKMGFMEHIAGDSDRARELFEAARLSIEALEDEEARRRLFARYYSALGFITANTVSRSKGLELSREAIQLYREMDDRVGEARGLLNMCAVLSGEGNYEERIKLLNEAVKALIEVGDTHSIMVAYVNLGQVYHTLHQTDMSEDYFRRCLELSEATGTRRFEVWCYCYFGLISQADNEFENAREWFVKAMESASKLGLGRMEIVSKLNMALLLLETGELEEARRMIADIESSDVAQKMGGGLASAMYLCRGLDHYTRPTDDKARELEEAEKYFGKARTDEDALDVTQDLDSAYYLAQCLKDQGKTEECRKVVSRARKRLDEALSRIRSGIYRDGFCESEAVSGIIELDEELGSESESIGGEGE